MSFATELYAALAVLVATGIWILVRSGNPNMSPRDSFGEPLTPSAPTRREELLKARARVKWQLSLGSIRRRGGDDAVKADLQAILEEINAELAETAPDKRASRRGLRS
jgi:hypothetical protein